MLLLDPGASITWRHLALLIGFYRDFRSNYLEWISAITVCGQTIEAVLQNLSSCFATEQHQELEHAIGALKSEKSQVENQLKVLQQKNEIMVEMYQQKENALQQ